MIALIAVITAASIGVISVNGFSAIPLATASVSPESGTMMGHVEYIVRDANNNIKSYTQGDNMVVNKGDDCVIGYAFQTTAAGGPDNCTVSADGFRFIGIGNMTHTVFANSTTLVGQSTTVASSGINGLMAVRNDTNTVGTASSDGGTVVIATETPFLFFTTTGQISNATTVTTAGLFDATCSAISSTGGHCTANAGVMNMFSAQQISVAVGNGDSLSVTWTITVGNAS